MYVVGIYVYFVDGFYSTH